jgi:hypothetical protein
MKYAFFLLVLTFALVITGCPPAKETTKVEEPPPPPPVEPRPAIPEVFVRVASIDLSSVPRKIEKKDIESIAGLMKKENIDILSVQGITRYPELKNRIDVFEEIAAATDMRKVWGENITFSGRQIGNAVFSTYPIRSHVTTGYKGIASANYESALQAVVDCGLREVIVVSSRLPADATAADITTCLSAIETINREYAGMPIILSGNLPSGKPPEGNAGYQAVPGPASSVAPKIWYSSDGSLLLKLHHVSETSLRPVTVTEFGIFRKGPR